MVNPLKHMSCNGEMFGSVSGHHAFTKAGRLLKERMTDLRDRERSEGVGGRPDGIRRREEGAQLSSESGGNWAHFIVRKCVSV